MIKKSLVVVLGAGASNEIGLPVGSMLKHRVAQLMTLQQPNGPYTLRGDDTIADALERIATKEHGIPQLAEACKIICGAMPLAPSIDTFIDSHRDVPLIARCGKLAITQAILRAEADSTIYVNRRNVNNTIDFGSCEQTWYNRFFQLLCDGCDFSEFTERLQSVAVVIFNYDRCFEHFMFHSVRKYFAVRPDEAAESLRALTIFHPYGRVGILPFRADERGVPFGDSLNGSDLAATSALLRTFTEGVDPTVSEVESIREAMMNANKLLFLGFAFHKLNVELLFPKTGVATGANKQTFATTLGMSASDKLLVVKDLSSRLGVALNIGDFHDTTSVNLLEMYRRSLAFT